jgi:hypothetical protein
MLHILDFHVFLWFTCGKLPLSLLSRPYFFEIFFLALLNVCECCTFTALIFLYFFNKGRRKWSFKAFPLVLGSCMTVNELEAGFTAPSSLIKARSFHLVKIKFFFDRSTKSALANTLPVTLRVEAV